MTENRYYQIVLLWLKDRDRFARYLELAAPVVGRYGGALERMLEPAEVHGRLAKPDAINVVFYDSRDAFAALGRDPDFQPVLHLRSESIDMISLEGMPDGGGSTQDGLFDRVYQLELARFGTGGESHYREVEAEREALLRPFGHRIERRLVPDGQTGFPFHIDIAVVSYFDAADGPARLRADPVHARLEEELCPRAVAESIRVVGRALR